MSANVSDHCVIVDGVRLHVVEQGTGPLVLLVHGFPETWYSWRAQLPALAAAGYRAVAMDVRGYGRSSKPDDISEYRMTRHVDDNVALVRALGAETAIVVGHDWGSPIAANSALLRPDVFTAVAMLSVPYIPRGGPRPTELFAAAGGEAEFYISYFQQAGRVEAEIEPDVATWVRGMYVTLSGEHAHSGASAFFIPPGGRLVDGFSTADLPAWLSPADLAVYVADFERTGLTGGLNRYRNVDRDWMDLADYDGAAITQPSLFIGGMRDPVTILNKGRIDAFPTTLPGLRGAHLLDRCGHWIQQERADEVNSLLLEWLGTL